MLQFRAQYNKNVILHGGIFCISDMVPYLLLARQAPVSDHLSPTPLVATSENHFHKQPAPVTDTFFRVSRVSAYKSCNCVSRNVWAGIVETNSQLVCIKVRVILLLRLHG